MDITQPSLRELSFPNKFAHTVLKIKNIEFQFIYHNENIFSENQRFGLIILTKSFCADLEKLY